MNGAATDPVLVTGAFGQVGRRCTEILLERGRTVVAMDLHNDKTASVAEDVAARARPGTLIPAYVDLLDEEAVAALVAAHRPGAIVHLAAIFAPTSYRNPETPVNPIDQYGEDKVLAEKVIKDSGLPSAVLRLAGIISPDGAANLNSDYLLLMRATPGDNRMHTVDARDVGLAFANAVDRGGAIDGKVLLIAGDETHVRTHRELEDDVMHAVGLGRLGAGASLPGDPEDDRGWSFTGWFDTAESQALLDFQRHTWAETVQWVADAMGARRAVISVLGPVARPLLRLVFAVQRRVEKRGPFADPWSLIAGKYGPDVLAPTDFQGG